MHEESDWIVDKAADYQNDGSRHTVCEKCGKTLNEEIIPQLVCEHTACEWVIEKDTSKSDEGLRKKLCKICNAEVDEEAIPKIELDGNEVKARLEKSIVKVLCYDYSGEKCTSQGSGFFIDEKGTFVTNAHVAKDAYHIRIETYDKKSYDVKLIFEFNDENSDYAILRAEACASLPVEFDENAGVGDAVYAIGYPDNANTLQCSSGKILRTNVKDEEIRYFENSANIEQGSSGGVLADSHGRVIGITTGKLANMNYAAIPCIDIKEALTQSYTEGKSPLEWFHSEISVDFTTKNIENYFNLKVDASAIGEAEIFYDFTVKIKSVFLLNEFRLDTESLGFTLSVKTVYSDTKSGAELTHTSGAVEFLFDSENDIISGVGASLKSSPELASLKGVSVSYELSYTDAHGTLVFTE